ncbi:pyridoxal phosphate-dependent transferase [Penicillium waksmanii]|uniref:pyridoxal phosphate-dependent transferase n=1 Tax=Penicillium waksmanii TaxID=69791 RepID=UPI00254984F4|nr:pyridoxal phosphate-dependent transferase [Penicillium waksmanii]KAJ5979997.1 pyridoxal phosphate-dependent transferase [Penicillium waksmanii]
MVSNSSKPDLKLSPRVKELLDLESRFTAGGFDPMPYFFEKGQGSLLWDVDGKEYIDFIGMFSAVNTGHCHPYIQEALTEQLKKGIPGESSSGHSLQDSKKLGYQSEKDPGKRLYHSWSRGFLSWALLGGLELDEFKSIEVNNGKEYGLDSKIQMNINPGTGELLEYLDLEKIRSCLKEHKDRVAAVIMECIHGYSRDMNDEVHYARGVYEICKSMNILFIADEVRQGAGKTGKFFSFQHLGDDVKPDIVTMGKSITGGFYPQSFIMGMDTAMAAVGPYEMASTYGFSPLAIAAANATIDIIYRENLIERGVHLGYLWRKTVESWQHPLVDYVAQIGADSNLILREVQPSRVAALCMHRGLFVYPKADGIRLSFAMNMPDEVLLKGAAILKSCLDDIDKYGSIEGEMTRYRTV